MQIYNITKERVTDLVNRAFDSNDGHKDLCLCYQCRLDVTCYVLNRAKPVYVLSERGIAHLKDNYSNSLQELADLTRLVENGISLVSKAKRSHHLEPYESDVVKADAYFNFPTITGAILAGDTFAPVDANVKLLFEKEIVAMKDSKWLNPMTLTKSSNENFFFWPKALPADNPGIERTFLFQVLITSDLYESTSHFFELKITSTKNINYQFEAHNTYTSSNILLFKAD